MSDLNDLEREFAREPSYELSGPFQTHEVIVGGRRVPYLMAIPGAGGRIFLSLDSRYGLDLSLEEADRVVPFLANAIAIGLGYTCHPDAEMEPLRAHHMPRVHTVVAASYEQVDGEGAL